MFGDLMFSRRCCKLLVAFRIQAFFQIFLVMAAGVVSFQLSAAPLEQWHWRSPLPQGNGLNNVVFANGRFIAVGELGTILVSSDGINWVRRESGVLDELRDCAYGNGRYVVVGDYGTVLTSTDALTWVPQYGSTFYSLKGITYGNGQFVAVGEQTTIIISLDGVNWIQQSSGEWDLYDVDYGAGVFVAVGGIKGTTSYNAIGVILSSADGHNWTRRELDSDGPIVSLVFGGGQFAAINRNQYEYDKIWTSANGLSWQVAQTAILYPLNGIAYGQGKWVIAAGNLEHQYDGTGRIMISEDLVQWSDAVTNIVVPSAVAFGNGRLVASRMDGSFLTSSNTTNWSNPYQETPILSLNDVKYINGSFWGVARDKLVISVDGSSWTNVVALTNVDPLVSITYGFGRFVAGSESHTIWTSTNGVDWTNAAPELNPSYTPVAITFGNGLFVGASGYSGDILVSTNGVNWSVQQLQTNGNSIYFRGITFGNGRFVAVSENAYATSTDGTNWFLNTDYHGLTSVTWGDGIFVAVGPNIIMTSADGTNWNSQSSAQFGYLNAIAYGSGYFVAVGGTFYFSIVEQESPIWISTDAVHWSKCSSKTSLILSTVAFGDGTFVIGSSQNGILQSDPVVTLELAVRSMPELSLAGPMNRSYRIEYSDNLGYVNSWITLTNLVSTNTSAQCFDPGWTNSSKRFYRAVLIP